MTPADIGIAAATMENNTTISFTQKEVDNLISAAREATIRFKRARTHFRDGDPNYSHWDEDILTESIQHYSNLEDTLRAKYTAHYGEW